MADEFPKRLRQLRKQTGISRYVLSELCGINKNAVSDYESGKRLPSFKSLMKLADFFEVSLDWLCGRENIF